jgi:hypothetical protein
MTLNLTGLELSAVLAVNRPSPRCLEEFTLRQSGAIPNDHDFVGIVLSPWNHPAHGIAGIVGMEEYTVHRALQGLKRFSDWIGGTPG